MIALGASAASPSPDESAAEPDPVVFRISQPWKPARSAAPSTSVRTFHAITCCCWVTGIVAVGWELVAGSPLRVRSSFPEPGVPDAVQSPGPSDQSPDVMA